MGFPSYVPTPSNLQVPSADVWSNPDGSLTQQADQYMRNLLRVIQQIAGIRVYISGTDATSALQVSINQAVKQGGGVVILPAGLFTMGTVSIPVGSGPIWIVGQGPATVLTRNVALPAGMGMFDISSSNVTLSEFVIDGGTTVPMGLLYGSGFSTSINANDPMAPSLTTNTSVWVHGPAESISFARVRFQHAGGYSVLLDALTGDISNVDVTQCSLVNNRPTLFGANPGQAIYGSWNGGILAKSDGRAASGGQSGVITNLLVQGCRFQRNTGNCLWSHAYGFARFNSGFRYLGNYFLDCGLDGILVDVVSGGTVEANVMRRIGYTTQTDTDQSVPQWLVGLNATGIDSGVVKGVNYVGNSLLSINGGMIDLDTHCLGSVTGNICRIPYADEPEYVEDQIAITGPSNNANSSYGLNLGVNYPVAEGGEYIDISSNTLLNLPEGAMRLYSARYCHVVGNIIDAPDTSPATPIIMGPQGAAAYNRCYGNRIHHNQIRFAPGGALAAIKEDDSLSGGNPMTGGDINYVYGNAPILGGGAAIEFAKAGGSGSTVYAETVWFP